MNDVCKCLKCGWFGRRDAGDTSYIHTVDNCFGEIVDVPLSKEEYSILLQIAIKTFNTPEEDRRFYNSMVDLKENDIVEYGLKMSQFRTQIEQQKANTILRDTSPQCPNCHSTMIRKIDALERAGSVAMLGIFSKKINKSFKCQKCGYTW